MRIRATGSAMKRGGGGAGGSHVDCVTALIKVGREHDGEETGSRQGGRQPSGGKLRICIGRSPSPCRCDKRLPRTPQRAKLDANTAAVWWDRGATGEER